MTVHDAVTAAAAKFAADSLLSDQARRDAELLLMHRLQISRAALRAHPQRELTSPQEAAFAADVERRLCHEPIQYITGEQEFYGLALRVTPAVLIPRPETEHLVEAVLERLPKDRTIAILDIGTGSGAIAVALAVHLPQAMVTALDLSATALEVARANAAAHSVGERIHFLESDLLEGVNAERFDAIVSNPPYIPSGERATLHPQVREHEPPQALFAGAAGLDIYERLIPQARSALLPGGLLAMEIGAGQQASLESLLRGWDGTTFVDDLQGIARVVLATRPR
jgi:release factor glutamine methyltransferase